MKETSEVLYSWSFSAEKNRWKLWYTIALSLVIWIVIWWFIMKQYWLSFVIMIISGIYIFIENNWEWNVIIKLTNLWIFIDNFFYEYSSIRWYSIIYDDTWTPILLRLYFNTGIKVLDLDINLEITNNIKNILWNYLEENENWELTFWDKIIRLLKL
jgi:hypothetical protein